MWLVCGLCLISLFVACQAAPISRESSSNEGGIYFDKSREKFANDSVCVSDDVLYKENDVIPTASMCERCVCRPPDITCEIIQCEKSGCRAIQSPDICCPEYRCDCEAGGRIYQNGERLENPESPCRVCYCQSGEIVCTVIKCYTREDCTPHYVTGMCCPKYDHCPPVDPAPLMFYTTPETSSQSPKTSSFGYEADIAETSNISHEKIQENTVDTSKWIELLEENSNALLYSPNTLDDYGKDISLMHTSVETNFKENNDRDKLHKDNTGVYDESEIIGETSKIEGYYKAKQQEHNTETYTESAGTNEESMRQENDKEEVKDNTEFYTDSTGTETTSNRGSSDKLELQQINTEVYNESTGTGEISKREDSDKEVLQQDNTEAYTESAATKQTDGMEENNKEELPNNTEAYTEGAGTGEARRPGSDKEEEQDKIQVYSESTVTGEMSKTEDKKEPQQDNTEDNKESTSIVEMSKRDDKQELQQDNTEVNNENTDTGETSKTEGRNKEKMQQYNTDFYTENISTAQSSKIEGKGKDEVQGNTEAYAENTGTGETSGTEGDDNGGVQGNTEVYTESADTGEKSKIEGSDKEEVPDNTEVYTENTGTVESSKIEGNDEEEVQDNSEVNTENTGTGKTSKIEGNDEEEVQDNSEVNTENTGTGKTSKIEGKDKEEVEEKTEVYTESADTGERNKIQGNDKSEIQENAEVYTENTGTGETTKIEGNDKEEVQDNSVVNTANTGTGETSKIEGNDEEEEEVQDNSEVSTENTGTGKTSKKEGNDEEEVQGNSEVNSANTGTGKTSRIDGKEKEELQVQSEVYTKNTETAGASKMVENDKEMQQDNTEIYAASTDTGEAKKREGNDKEELQQDDTEVYVESTVTGETRKREGNDTQELQEDSLEVFTEGTGNSVPTHRSDEDKTDILLQKIENKVVETWSEETTTSSYHHILKSEEAKNNDKVDEEASSAHATNTEDNGMVKDGGAVRYIQEVRRSSTETITYKTPQDIEKNEITRNISKHNQSDSGIDPTRYETSVDSREGIMTGFTGDDDIESLNDSGEIDQGKYHEDNTESSNTESSSTTAVPDRYTQLTEHESRDTVPVVTFQSNMELHDMDLVVPGLDNTKLQVDYDIKTTEENPVIGIGTEINATSEYSDVTNITIITNISSGNDPNMRGLDDKTLQNSREESENINKDEFSTSSLAFSTALTINPTTDVTSELQNTERSESSEPTTVQSETTYSTEIHLSVASLLMHDSATKTQNEEITSFTVDSTTPDVLEGEHPLKQRTEQTDATVKETLQDVTAANSISDSNNMQEKKAMPHISDEGVSHTAQTSESITANDWNTALADETEKSVLSTAGATEASEKILGGVGAFKSNKTANTTETSDILQKEWLKTHQVTTVTNPEGVHMEEEDGDKSQTTFNHDKAEEFTSAVNYSYDEIRSLYEPKSGDKTDQPKETDTTNTEWATESMLTTTSSFENTDKVDDYPPNRNDSQMPAHDFFNESQSANDKGTNNASGEMEETTGTQGISTTLNYSSHEKEKPLWNNLFSQHSEKHNEGEGSDTSTTDIIHHKDSAFTGGATSSAPGENEGWISDAFKKPWNKQPNKFEKNYPESFSTEDKSTAVDQHETDEPIFAKEVQSAVYSSSSYEMNSHAFYGIGDYYVSSSESDLTYNMTDVHSEATSTVTSTSSEEQSTDLMTVRSRENGNEETNAQEYTDNETTRPTESGETKRTVTALESTTPILSENVHNSTEITKSSEINIKNSLEDNQNAASLDGNVAKWKLEQALYESSDSQQENYSTL